MSQSNQLTTTLGRTWKIKTIIFAIALLALGLWGAWDALIVYPKRGRAHAEFAFQDYLESAQSETGGGSSFIFRKSPGEMSVADPAGERRRLTELKDDGVLGQPGYEVEAARLVWLGSLSRIASLSSLKAEADAEIARRAAEPTSAYLPTGTLFVDLYKSYDEITQKNGTRNRPSPLNAFDIPLQYLFMIVGFAGCAYMILFFVRVKRRVFTYDPAEKKLTLTDGRSFTPADIETVDKRKWDKFLVFMTLKDGSPEFRLDLYRYDPLETWIIEMEKLAPGYEPIVEEGDAVLCVDVLSGVPVRLTPDTDTTLPAPNDAEKPVIYPALKTVTDEWFVVGASQRAGLRDGAEKGTLDREALKVNLETFQVAIAEHDPEGIPERDLRPNDEDEEEADELEQIEEKLTDEDSLNV